MRKHNEAFLYTSHPLDKKEILWALFIRAKLHICIFFLFLIYNPPTRPFGVFSFIFPVQFHRSLALLCVRSCCDTLPRALLVHGVRRFHSYVKDNKENKLWMWKILRPHVAKKSEALGAAQMPLVKGCKLKMTCYASQIALFFCRHDFKKGY